MTTKKLTKEEINDTKNLRRVFQELEWRQQEIINGRLSAYDLSNRLVSIAWRVIEVVVPELAALLKKYNTHHCAEGDAVELEKFISALPRIIGVYDSAVERLDLGEKL